MLNNIISNVEIKKASKVFTFSGLAIIILGILSIVYPEIAGKISITTLGVFLITGGVIRLVLSSFSYSMSSWFLKILYSGLLIAGGIWSVSNPEMGLEALTIAMAIIFILDGLTQLIYSFYLIPVGGGIFMLISSSLNFIIGILILMHWPESSEYIIGIYLGIKLIIDGLMLSLTGRSIKNITQ